MWQVRHRWRGMCSYAGDKKQGEAMCQLPNGTWAWEASAAAWNPGFICGMRTAGHTKQEASSSESSVSNENLMAALVVVGGILLVVAILLVVRRRGGNKKAHRYILADRSSGDPEQEDSALSMIERFVPALDPTRAHVDAEATNVLGRGACSTVYRGTYERKRGVARAQSRAC